MCHNPVKQVYFTYKNTNKNIVIKTYLFFVKTTNMVDL